VSAQLKAASPQPLAGLRAVVTGAAGGIGRAVVLELLGQGAEVQGVDRDADALHRLAAELSGAPFSPHLMDLADRGAADRGTAGLLEGLGGRCDILVNNAGIARMSPLADSDDALLDAMFAVNFHAAFRLTRMLLPALGASGRGSIVNIASELALIGASEYGIYCATKGAVLAWSRALAVELAARRIRVNAVCPGPVETALLQREFATHGRPAEARSAEIALVPLARLGAPADISAVVAFLAGDAAAFVTGAVWTVDGGKTAQ
jgi:NAD(P)-dependent dehydrogenase (short-subunit alcohol dehydrogenase family)